MKRVHSFLKEWGRSGTPLFWKEKSGSGTPSFDKERERSGTLKKWERLTHWGFSGHWINFYQTLKKILFCQYSKEHLASNLLHNLGCQKWVHVTMQEILNKIGKIKFSVGCMVLPWCWLFQCGLTYFSRNWDGKISCLESSQKITESMNPHWKKKKR